MDTRQVGSAVLTGSITGFLVVLAGGRPVAAMSPPLSSLANLAQAHQSLVTRPAPVPAVQIAQYTPVAPSTETGCRQTNATTGLYAQPSLDSSSRAILNSGQTVRLELVGTGTGWARVTAPAVGWVESRYLTPPTACTGLPPASFQAAAPAQGVVQPAPAVPSATPTVSAVCEVLPSEGLVVRSEPSISPSTALHTIPKGVHQFQFTTDHLISHVNSVERRWVYITAPYPGWISLGVVGGSFNLGGKTCG